MIIIIISSSPPPGGARHTGVYASQRAIAYEKVAHFFEKMEYGNENGGPQPGGSGTDDAVSSALRSLGASLIGQLRMPWEHGMAAVALGLAPQEALHAWHARRRSLSSPWQGGPGRPGPLAALYIHI